MAPSRFKKEAREKREVTPFNEEPNPLAPPDIPAEWRDIEAPVNFTWVVQDELAGMGWPKSRDQINFLIRQGIDHLITLAADKIPPYYAFPELKWTMIPVEDFTGPSIVDIKKFIQIVAEARRNSEVFHFTNFLFENQNKTRTLGLGSLAAQAAQPLNTPTAKTKTKLEK